MGKPIVSTNLPWVCDFNERHQVLVTTDERPEEFLRGIEHAFSLKDDDALIARRRAVAREADWEARLESMSELIPNHWSKSSRTSPSALVSMAPTSAVLDRDGAFVFSAPPVTD
jgi:hypothetical protein